MFLKPDWLPLGEWIWAINGDSTGPSRALDQATQSRPLSHDSLGSALQALGCEAHHSSTRLEILQLVTETLQTEGSLWNWQNVCTSLSRSPSAPKSHNMHTTVQRKGGELLIGIELKKRKVVYPVDIWITEKKIPQSERQLQRKTIENQYSCTSWWNKYLASWQKKRTSYSWTVETIKHFSINISKSCIYIYLCSVGSSHT